MSSIVGDLGAQGKEKEGDKCGDDEWKRDDPSEAEMAQCWEMTFDASSIPRHVNAVFLAPLHSPVGCGLATRELDRRSFASHHSHQRCQCAGSGLRGQLIKRISFTMPQSCKDIRAALAFCLQNSDCIMVERNSPGDCLRPPLKYTLPTQCQQLQKGYAECKKGMIDMRKRFRGNRPVGVAELETGAHGKERSLDDDKAGTIEEKGYMLYAGRPLKGVRETKGNENPEAGDEGQK